MGFVQTRSFFSHAPRSPHDLRHTYATMLLMDHYSPAYVQKQLGHHSISMTVDIYGHWIPGEGKKDLTKTLRGPKACPGQTLALVTGADSPTCPSRKHQGASDLANMRVYCGAKLGPNWCKTAKTKGVTPWDYALFNQMVPKRGFEPRRGNPHWTLNPARLPVPPLRPNASNLLGIFHLIKL